MTRTQIIYKTPTKTVIVMQNYEALGRYISAREQAEKFAEERNQLLSRTKKLLDSAAGYGGSSGYLAHEFDPAEAMELINQIAEIQAQMLAAMQEANSQADLCGKSKLALWKPPRY